MLATDTSDLLALQLDLRHYETVLAIVELETMTAAATELSTSQSALSHRLAEAERRLGTALFDRGPRRRLKPTTAGLVVSQAARRVIADLERTEAFVVAEKEGITAKVRIAVGSYDCYHWYPAFVSAASERHPWIELELVAVGDTPGQALAAGKVDLVIAPGDPQGPVSLGSLFDDELVLVVDPSHRLTGRESIEAADLIDEIYLTYNPIPTPGFEYDRFFRPGSDHPRIVKVVQQTSAIVELVAAGAGVSILSRWALAPAIESGRIVPIRCGTDGLGLPWSHVLRTSERPDAPARLIALDLADHLRSAAPPTR